MDRNKIIAFIILIAIIVIAGWQLFSFSNRLESTAFLSEPRTEPSTEVSGTSLVAAPAVVVVDDSSGSPQSFELEVTSTTTAFNLLERVSSLSGIEIESTDYGEMGIFIEAIGAQKNGTENKYWLYYVNGNMPVKAVDKQVVKPGDKVEFKFEKSPF